jgi:hypothetical protein
MAELEVGGKTFGGKTFRGKKGEMRGKGTQFSGDCRTCGKIGHRQAKCISALHSVAEAHREG